MRARQEDLKFKACWDDLARPCLNIKKEKGASKMTQWAKVLVTKLIPRVHVVDREKRHLTVVL